MILFQYGIQGGIQDDGELILNNLHNLFIIYPRLCLFWFGFFVICQTFWFI